ncbi:S-layer homology domain-containing protein [Microcoleus sp. F8_C2]
MVLQIHQFSRGFHETQKEGLWVSGGFGEPIARDDFPVPQEIKNAISQGLFKIPDQYRPYPGAEALINSGQPEKIAQPELDSIAIIAREIGNYSVLAVATGQIDDKGRDLIVGYQYFWLNTEELKSVISTNRDPDGILTLLSWWKKNRFPSFNMNPSSQSDKGNTIDKLVGKVPLNLEANQKLKDLFRKLENNYPPCLFEARQDGIQISNTSFFDLHNLARKMVEIYPHCPLAWAWNVRGLLYPEEFAAIYCADPEALDRINKQKQRLPKKYNKHIPQPNPASFGSSTSDTDDIDDTRTIETKTHTGSATSADPDSLMLMDKIDNKIQTLIRINPPKIESILKPLQELLNLYQKYPASSHKQWIKLFSKKIEECHKKSNISISEERYAILLFILTQDTYKTKKIFLISEFKYSQDLRMFLEVLSKTLTKIRKYDRNNITYNNLNRQISKLINPNSSFLYLITRIDMPIRLANLLDWLNLSQTAHTSNPSSRNDSPSAEHQFTNNIAISSNSQAHNNTAAPESFPLPSDVPDTSNNSPKFNLNYLIAISAAILAVLIIRGFLATIHFPHSLGFQDIQNHWAKNYIQALAEKKIITVHNNGNYRPDLPMTRAEFAAILTKAFEVPESNDTSSPFTDVKNNHWAYKPIMAAYSSKFFAGSNDGRFYPEYPVTRLAILQTLVKTFKLNAEDAQDIDLSFYQDKNQITKDEVRKVIVLATKAGLVINYSNPCLLELERKATRAEVAAIVYQALVKANKADTIDFPQSQELKLQARICHLQQLEARSDEYANKEVTQARKNLIQWMKDMMGPAIEVLKTNASTENEKKSAREKIEVSASYLNTLIPQKLWEGAPPERLKMEDSNQEAENVKKLKATLKVLNLYSGSIDSIFDDTLKQVVVDFQMDKNIITPKDKEEAKSHVGQVGPNTWAVLTQTFKDAHLIVAYSHIIKGLEAGQKFSQIVEPLKKCQENDPLGYVSCVNNDKS